jgi:hypothetical protein
MIHMMFLEGLFPPAMQFPKSIFDRVPAWGLVAARNRRNKDIRTGFRKTTCLHFYWYQNGM